MWRLVASQIAARRRRRQKGQTLIIIAFLSVFLITLLGLVVDSVRLYILAAQAERSAEAAALAGALYMPNYFDVTNQAPDGHYAQERACAVLQQNGITNCPVAAGQVGGQVSIVPTNQYEIQVTVTLQADVFFLQFVSPGLSTATVSRSALAEFLPPIVLGSRYPYFGDEADIDQVTSKPVQSFWASINGPLDLKEQGDAYTPTLEEGPTDAQKYPDGGSRNFSRWGGTVCCTNHQQYGQCTGCPSGPITNPDVHQTGFTGYNYQIVVPANSGDLQVQIFNPAFVHGDTVTGDTVTIDATKDPAFGGKTDQKNEYMQMTYTLYSAPLLFERSQDVMLGSPFQPASLDVADKSAHGCSAAWDPQAQQCLSSLPSYVDNWYILYIIPNSNKPATYRLSVNATDYYGSKNYGLKVTPKGSAPTSTAAPAGVRIFAWNEMCVFFNLSGGSGDSFFDIGEIPADYAGKTLHFKLFDPGETSGSSSLDMFIHDPSGAAIQLPNWLRTTSNGTDLETSINGDHIYNGLWLDMPIGIPPTYNPAPGSDWWQVEYKATGSGVSNDKITISIGLSGTPVHLVNEIP
jgi:hypothetical protein